MNKIIVLLGSILVVGCCGVKNEPVKISEPSQPTRWVKQIETETTQASKAVVPSKDLKPETKVKSDLVKPRIHQTTEITEDGGYEKYSRTEMRLNPFEAPVITHSETTIPGIITKTTDQVILSEVFDINGDLSNWPNQSIKLPTNVQPK